MNFEIFTTLPVVQLYLGGVLTTIQLLLLCIVIGGSLAIPLAILRNARSPWIRGPIWFYTYVMRGTPILIQLYLIYYGVAQLDWIQTRWDTVWPWVYFKDAFFCVALTLTLNTCGYTIELLAGALRDTPKGEIEAAMAMGMTRFQINTRIILPSAIRRVLPAYSNEVIMMLQGTSLASVVPSILELTGAARQIYSDYYLPFEAFITVGIIYLLATFVLVGLFKWAERYWLAHLRPRVI